MAYIKISYLALMSKEERIDIYINTDKIVSVRSSVHSTLNPTEIDCDNGKTYQCADKIEFILTQIGNFK